MRNKTKHDVTKLDHGSGKLPKLQQSSGAVQTHAPYLNNSCDEHQVCSGLAPITKPATDKNKQTPKPTQRNPNTPPLKGSSDAKFTFLIV